MKESLKLDTSALIEEFHVPLHVRRHCKVVTKFALQLGKKLVAAGENVNLELLRDAGMVHDLVRIVDFKKFSPEKFPYKASAADIEFWLSLREKYAGRRHEEVAAEILRERGFAKIAKIVAAHRFLQIEKGFDSWEEKLLYYADKRTEHEKIVTLAQRLSEGRKRNAPETIGTESARKIDEKIFALEREILGALNLKR